MKRIEEERDSRGRLSLQKMIFDVSTFILARSRVPKLLYALGNPLLNRINEAYETFETFMREQIKVREVELEKVRSTPGSTEDDIADAIGDVFGRLVSARIGEGKLSMTDEEIIGNCFIFVSKIMRESNSPGLRFVFNRFSLGMVISTFLGNIAYLILTFRRQKRRQILWLRH